MLLCERRRTCYCMSLHTHSRGNTPAETTAVLQHSFFVITVMTIYLWHAEPHRDPGAQQRAGRVWDVTPFSLIFHQYIWSPCAAVPFTGLWHKDMSNQTQPIVHLSLKLIILDVQQDTLQKTTKKLQKNMHYAKKCQYLNAFLFIHFKVKKNLTGFTMIGRNDIPSIWVSLTLYPAMSRIVGPKSTFAISNC